MFDYEIKAETEIKAPVNIVWKVLTDFGKFQEWNHFITNIEGRAEMGERLAVTVEPPGLGVMKFRPEIQVLDKDRELCWLGTLAVAGIFSGRHSFRLEELENFRTRLIHSESFSGVLAPVVRKRMERPTLMGFEMMNEEVKVRAEAMSRGEL